MKVWQTRSLPASPEMLLVAPPVSTSMVLILYLFCYLYLYNLRF